MLVDDEDRGAPLTLRGSARDLLTEDGAGTEVGAATVTATLDASGRLATLDVAPAAVGATQLLGRPVAGGFRAALADVCPTVVAARSPLALLLDDLPVAALISGYARLYIGDVPASTAAHMTKADICSGWREGGTMVSSVRSGYGVPVTIGPSAPDLPSELAADPDGWHAIGPLAPGAMRRRRLVDVAVVDESWDVIALFRDTHVDGDGVETVLHEYTLTATIDAATRCFTACAAVPRVLPWVECPVAAASAGDLVGVAIDDVREVVRTSMRGTSTCTHLNDLLRSLGDVGPLVDLIARSDQLGRTA
jgi:hypothetical protein